MADMLDKIKDLILRKDDIAVMCVQVDFFLLLEGPERAHYEILDKS